MKTVTPELATLINSGDFAQFDLYTIDLAGGGQLLMTSADIDIAFGGTTWSAQGARIAGTQALAHWKIGLDVDQWQVSVTPRRVDDFSGAAFPDRIGSAPWLQAAAQGVLDNAQITVSRAYFGPVDRGIDIFGATDVFALEDIFAQDPVAVPTYPLPPGGAVPVGVLTIFVGNVAEVDVSTTMAVLTINDARQILTTQMPRNLYQASCRHRLFDSGCQLVDAAYAQQVAVAVQQSRALIVFTPAWQPIGSGYLSLGRMRVLSGANAGVARTIAAWDTGTTIAMQSPFPFDFAVGDAVVLYPGCDKSMGACTKFGNLINYGGDPYIPVPETTS